MLFDYRDHPIDFSSSLESKNSYYIFMEEYCLLRLESWVCWSSMHHHLTAFDFVNGSCIITVPLSKIHYFY